MSQEGREALSPGSVLLVEDERFFQELMGGILSGAGYAVEVAGSGEEALEAFSRSRFPVVVLDLVLPDVMGTDVLARLREADPEVAVIMVTAYASLESAITALKAGAYDYIQKPIVREDLLSAVERALERQRLASSNRALLSELEVRVADLARLSREKEQVFRVLDEGLVIVDGSGAVRDINPRAATLLGSSPGLLAGRPFSEVAFPLDRRAQTRGGAPAGEPARVVVEHPAPEGGDLRVFEVAVLPFHIEDPPGAGRLVSLWDVTEKRNLERRREEFLSIVSHDLRTPLTSLKGFIELLLAGKYESPQVLREYLAILDSEADRMISLINDLLDLSRIDEGKMELHPEEGVAEDLVLYAQRSMEGLAGRRGVALVMRAGEEEPHVLFADRQRLIQALVNLLANAIRFSPRGGTVETAVFAEGDRLVFTVADQGPGIPPAERERVFDKYRQLRDPAPERARGSGLGLTIVRKLVELHDGTVHVEDPREGHGSRFVIRLPWRREV